MISLIELMLILLVGLSIVLGGRLYIKIKNILFISKAFIINKKINIKKVPKNKILAVYNIAKQKIKIHEK